MTEQSFLNVEEVAKMLGVSAGPYAYEIAQRLNPELKTLGYLTISGRVASGISWKKLAMAKKKGENADGSL